MNIVKKIGLWIVIILAGLIKLPVTLITFIFGLVEFYLIRFNVLVAKAINNTWLKESLYYAMDVNIYAYENLAEMCEDMQEDLA